MDNQRKLVFLQYALVGFGIILLLVYPLMIFWPLGWRWQPAQYEYEQMIVGVYATLGIFLLRAAKNPLKNASLIWFTVWSSIVHATIMLLQVAFNTAEVGHLFGDIPALYLMAIVLASFMPRHNEENPFPR